MRGGQGSGDMPVVSPALAGVWGDAISPVGAGQGPAGGAGATPPTDTKWTCDAPAAQPTKSACGVIAWSTPFWGVDTPRTMGAAKRRSPSTVLDCGDPQLCWGSVVAFVLVGLFNSASEASAALYSGPKAEPEALPPMGGQASACARLVK